MLFLQLKNGYGTCTGTLVAPNLVLTARHCVSDTDEGAICSADGTPIQGGAVRTNHSASSIYVITGVNAASRLQSQNVDAQGSQIIVDESAKDLCNKDLAFVVLKQAIPNAKIAPLRLKGGARTGEKLTSVGWGLTENGDATKRMQRTGVEVLGVGPIVIDNTTNAGLGDSEFAVGESICSGDSGGPALDSAGAIVGVVSRGGNNNDSPRTRQDGCIDNAAQNIQTINFYTQLPQHKDLVDRAFAAAGATPIEEDSPPGAANGEACSADIDCSGNACVKKVCATACKTDSDCASNEQCKLSGGKRNCIAVAPAPTDPTDPGTTDGDAGDSPSTPQGTPSTTTTTTTTSCSTSGAGMSNGTLGLAGAFAAFAALLAGRRRRS